MVGKTPVYTRTIQGQGVTQLIDGAVNSKSRKAYSDRNNHQSYNLSDHKENKLTMQHENAFSYNKETNRQNAIS